MKRIRPIIAIGRPGRRRKVGARGEAGRELWILVPEHGSMYRAVAVAAREAGIDPDAANVEERLKPCSRVSR